ncbi:MAG: class I SAM-dependent methyltransferase [Clostridiaceae bacterium]|nr:class I SAM-dependent methyltransferase [Clostridiaceae bacterium]
MAYGEFAKIYDELINEDIDYDKISKRLKDIIVKYNVIGDDYLDLACGTGNVAIKISDNFKNTCCVDLSEDMLNEAQEKFKEKKVQAEFLCQDMSELNLNKEFDFISCVLDSSNYLIEDEDFESYINGVYNHLKNNGIFVFDINSYYKLSTILGNNTYTYNEDKVFYSWENVFEDDVVNMFLTFFVKKGELYEKFEETHYERAYREEFIERVLCWCGFEILGKFDGYSDMKVNKESERILYVVRKNVEV